MNQPSWERRATLSNVARTTSFAACLVSATILAGCGGGSDGNDGNTSLVATVPEVAGVNCATGGTKVQAGQDVNKSGTLDASEVTVTQYVCNGATGIQGTAGAAGATGATGATGAAGATGATGATGAAGATGAPGSAGAAGAAGSTGATGAQGATGLSTLLTLTTEPAGANCAYGGTRADAGVDTDRSGVLDTNEITSTNFVCRASAGWVSVSANAQAVSNTGYLAASGSQVALTLPANPAVGDTISVSGAGAGGWKFVQNAGQSVRTTGLPGSPQVGTFTQTGSPQQFWWTVASSADGSKLIASTNGAINGTGASAYVSTDFGATWSRNTPGSNAFSTSFAATSSDGSHLVYAKTNDYVWTSSDSGATWSNNSGVHSWTAVATSGDGNTVLGGDNAGGVYLSTDAGLTWALSTTLPQGVTGASASGDGSTLVATANGGNIWVSTNGGTSWTARATALSWSAIAAASDGSHLAATVNGGQIYTSADSGATWTLQAGSPTGGWTGIASSSNGARLAAVDGGHTYQSNDSGVTWVQSGATSPRAVAMSAGGQRVVAATRNAAFIWSAISGQTTTGTGGSLAGSRDDSVTLQYLGNGVFIVLSYVNNSGTFTIQ